MLRRILAAILLAWALGFAWFALALPGPAGAQKTDGVIALTGGEGRIVRGLEALHKGWARQMLISGVDRNVRPHEFEVTYKVPADVMRCCVTLGFQAVDTRSNAAESARWIARNHFKSVRLVTSDAHMRRAAFELAQMQPDGTTVVRDAVPSHPTFKTLFVEYHKLLARVVARLWGG